MTGKFLSTSYYRKHGDSTKKSKSISIEKNLEMLISVAQTDNLNKWLG